MIKLYQKNNGVPGHRTIHDYLAMENIFYSYPTVFKYMRELGLHFIVCRKRPEYQKGKANKVFANLVNQEFDVSAPNKVWCTDFTYMPRPNGTMRYNCTIIALFHHSIVATLNASNITANLAMKTLKRALKQHKPDKVIF